MVQKEKTSGEKAKRGRPRAYDPEKALDSALGMFWRGGYSSTSLDELSQATGMNRPSLYAAFGDKRALYLQAIGRYHALSREQMRHAFSYEVPVRQALADVYGRALDLYFSGYKTPLGCFMLGTAVTEAVGDSEIREALAGGLREFDKAFIARVKAAQAAGEISGGRDPAMLGRIAASALYYLAVRSRAGEPREDLEKFAAAAVDLVCSA